MCRARYHVVLCHANRHVIDGTQKHVTSWYCAGGAFDPLGWSKGNLEDLKVKELKNGRLAMLAFLGFVAQYGATGDCLCGLLHLTCIED